MSREQKRDKPTVRVKPHTYQPSKAELEADVCIDTTPEALARKLGQQIVVQETLDDE